MDNITEVHIEKKNEVSLEKNKPPMQHQPINYMLQFIKKPTLILIDMNAYVHSSYHGYEEKLDVKGEDQRVLYGMVNALISLSFKIPKMDNVVVVFDPDDGSLYRKSIYPSYKENRPPPDENLVKQKHNAKKIMQDILGLICVEYPGYEADDIIGSLAYQYKKDYDVIIVSPDKDLAQLVHDNVFLYRKVKTKDYKGYRFLTEKHIKDEFGVHSHQITDWLSLMGDSSDNLPGIDKIGKKTASDILNTFPSVEHLITFVKNSDEQTRKELIDGGLITERMIERIFQSEDMILLVKELAKVKIDLDIEKYLEKSIQKSNVILSNLNYNQTLIKLEKFFNWPPNFKQTFWKNQFKTPSTNYR